MATNQDRIYSLDVQRDGDDHRMLWHFDGIEQAVGALLLCQRFNADVAFVADGRVAAGDFITDAEELRVWLAFEG